MWKTLGLAVLSLLFLSACPVGVKHSYDQKTLDLGVTTSATVAVGTLDHRSYVVDGKKAPNFVGLSRGGFGEPYDVATQSGNALATDISGSIAASMKSRGVDAKVVELKPSLTDEKAKDALIAAGAARSVMITVLEWKATTFMNVGLEYNLLLSVFDRDGKMLASKMRQGHDNLGPKSAAPDGSLSLDAQREIVVARYRRMMEQLFQEPDIAKALQP